MPKNWHRHFFESYCRCLYVFFSGHCSSGHTASDPAGTCSDRRLALLHAGQFDGNIYIICAGPLTPYPHPIHMHTHTYTQTHPIDVVLHYPTENACTLSLTHTHTHNFNCLYFSSLLRARQMSQFIKPFFLYTKICNVITGIVLWCKHELPFALQPQVRLNVTAT